MRGWQFILSKKINRTNLSYLDLKNEDAGLFKSDCLLRRKVEWLIELFIKPNQPDQPLNKSTYFFHLKINRLLA
jgi:hypothetical protein